MTVDIPEVEFKKEPAIAPELLKERLDEADHLAKSNLQSAIEKLVITEKQCRQGADLSATSQILLKIVELCRNLQQWTTMSEQVSIMSKKHGQLKQAITKMIQACMEALDDIPDISKRIEVIEALRVITEGKIFVEIERARLTLLLSKIKEDQGDRDAATEIICSVQVETFGSMDRREKTEYILEQFRLVLSKEDYVQAGIVSRRISTRYFKDLEVQDLKLRYYEMMIQLDLVHDKFLDVARHYWAVYETPMIQENEDKWKGVLENIIYFVVLAPHDNEQSDLLYRISADKKLSLLPLHLELSKCFRTAELMRWPRIAEIYGPSLKSTPVFGSGGEHRWDGLRKRNIRVVAKYYTRIRVERLNQLLDLSEKETEEYLSSLVTTGSVYARIDRPQWIVDFQKPKDASTVLNEWSGNISSLLGLIDKIGLGITKEEMMYGLTSGKNK
ncbi:26S proteasome regulatory subunit rpn5 [Neolecta irregularis DAH-3]|uniref:26S proteasome regulatory subunit rpn5 n=1 Tax=Neolecta irregularis (strain DAH-3) TaxID=1198029 RepID=A0A1U7LRF9_NEOID|nr:26S proteasome regulatory subunit rpn5 [Neolecta irregularis DAH-3]|eukprot:OLL25209.1 26S proteasome regulatory subunit rpn5 [Neolecta irregularis DAH-3]